MALQTSVPTILTLSPFSATSPSRRQALYSDISRQKLSNPTSYHSSVEWWRKALQSIVSSGLQTDTLSRLVLKADQSLLERVRVDGTGKPLALGAVVNELRAQKCLMPQYEFLNATKSVYDPGWLPGQIASFFLVNPLWWALEQLGVAGEEGILTSVALSGRSRLDMTWWGEYVFVPLVEQAAEKVLVMQENKASGAADRLYSLDGFRKEFGSALGLGTALNEQDAMVLLKFLERDRRVLFFDQKVVKFCEDGSGPKEINGVDRGILELSNAVKKLQGQVEELQSKIDQCTQKATAALRQKRKPMALNYLRSRKELEILLSKRLGSLGTLESTLISVEAAAGDIEIMKSYETSASTLRAILAHPSLQRESIEATLDAVAEANADAREVDETIKIGGDLAVGVEEFIDERELEAELRGLIQEAEGESEDTETRGKLEGIGMAIPAELPSVEKARVAAS